MQRRPITFLAVDGSTPKNWLQAGRSRVQVPVGEKDFALLQNFQTDYGAHPASTTGTRVLSLSEAAEA